MNDSPTPPDALDRLAAKKDGRPDRSVPSPDTHNLHEKINDRDAMIRELRATIDRKDFEIRAMQNGMDAKEREIARLQTKIDDMLGRARV